VTRAAVDSRWVGSAGECDRTPLKRTVPGPLAVVPDHRRVEFLQRLGMELEEHHPRPRDLLMRASTSFHGTGFTSPLSI